MNTGVVIDVIAIVLLSAKSPHLNFDNCYYDELGMEETNYVLGPSTADQDRKNVQQQRNIRHCRCMT